MKVFMVLALVALVAAKNALSTNLPPPSGQERAYSTYTGEVISDDEYQAYVKSNIASTCAIKFKDCDPNEKNRRLDGSCNNLEHPQKGTELTLVRRVLPAVFGSTPGEPRSAKSGNPLPLSRRVRTELVAEGHIPSPHYTQMLPNYWIFMLLDGTLSPDTLNYVIFKPYCCTPKASEEPLCAANPIPDDDPVHRFSEVRCMNMTKPTSYQNQGCLAKDQITSSDRINFATPTFDLSFLYGGVLSGSLGARLNESGLLRFETDDKGRIWPPSIKNNPKGTCRLNEEPEEVRCNDTPVGVSNTLIGVNLMTVWMWRNHNFIAKKLAEQNPNWDDEKLFYTARSINIAFAQQVQFYELYPLMMGKERMIKAGLIVKDGGFRDIYDPKLPPSMTHEYLYALRWVHTIQEGIVKQYDNQGNYLKQIPYGNLTYRTGYMANNMEGLTQGVFRQPCANTDQVVDPGVAEMSLGPMQRSLDLLTNDNAKNRYLGLQPYIQYLKHFDGKNYSKWSDLEEYIDIPYIEALKNVYESIEDVELLAGIWLERPLPDAPLPPTVFNLVQQQLIYNIKSDRFWFERKNSPSAFTKAQLAEIRKYSVARFLCDVGDDVDQIQPEVFRTIGPKNKLTSCSKIANINYKVFAEGKNSNKTFTVDNDDTAPPVDLSQ